jgi:uncharacterized repeat protein (TIGR01451 family)
VTLLAAVIALTTLVMAVGVASAVAAPEWQLGAITNSTVAPGGTLGYVVDATNIGDKSTDGSNVVLTATLPEKMTAQDASVLIPDGNGHLNAFPCKAGDGSSPVAGASTVSCTNGQVVPQFGNSSNWEELDLVVAVGPGASGTLATAFGVSGGGASTSSAAVGPVSVTNATPTFGLSAFDANFSDAAGNPVTQAGVHPDAGSFSFDFTTGTDPLRGPLWPVEPVKDLSTDLPPGLIGNPTVVGQCTASELANSVGIESQPLCPSSSQVGTALIRDNTGGLPDPTFAPPVPVYNMVPPPDAPVQLGFNVAGSIVTLDVHLRTGGDYGVTVTAHNIPEGITLLGTSLTMWGVPASPSHDAERACPGSDPPAEGGPSCVTNTAQRPFLRLPTSCTAPGAGLPLSASVDSWFNPGALVTTRIFTHQLPGYPSAPSEWGPATGIGGCEQVPFTPSLQVQPTTTQADSPTGLAVALTMPQQGLEEAKATGQADVRRTVVTLPEGMTVNPSQAQGLQACSAAQIGYLGNSFEAPSKIHFSAEEPACPDASKIGSVEVQTPLLSQPLKGGVYLAAQSENPFGALLAMYVVAQGQGVLIKLPGRIDLDPATGRLTATFEDLPQAPFSKFSLEFESGARAPLVNPATCGPKTIEATIEGWNGATVSAPSAYTVPCTTDLGGFAPSFAAGTSNPQAGAFAPFGLSFSRNDGEQRFGGLSFTMPPGVSAVLKGVERCSEAEVKAAESETGGCPEASRIGSVTVGSGAGPDPYFLKGTVYLTGPYNNGPFGEVVVVPAVAGPFNLGNVVVRGSIRVDARTAQPTVVSDPFPLFVKGTGIPTDVRRVDVSVDRPGFTFNPTNCNELHATGTLTSAQGATAGVSSRFQAAECRSLAFHPKFTASTQGNTSRKNGASLDVEVGFAPGQANIARVKVSLPRALPSRLDTLKLACTDAVFESNPAACPAASRVGTAVAKTPVLTATLTGPAYIVSHGGAAFPDVEMVLQGEGVTLVLDGKTDISPKTNITTSTFDTVPDVPVSSFELKLPEGAHSVLGAPGGNLCSKTLVMPTTLTGQNGAVLRQSTRIAVTGCKPAIRVLGHSVKGAQGSIRVAVPFAGTLVASGVGIARSVRHARGAQVVTIGVTLGDHARQVLAKNPSQRVNAKVTLRFTPKHGAPLTAHVSLLMG